MQRSSLLAGRVGLRIFHQLAEALRIHIARLIQGMLHDYVVAAELAPVSKDNHEPVLQDGGILLVWYGLGTVDWDVAVLHDVGMDPLCKLCWSEATCRLSFEPTSQPLLALQKGCAADSLAWAQIVIVVAHIAQLSLV